MFPENTTMQTGTGYPAAAMLQQNTPLLGNQPTDQLRIPQLPTAPTQGLNMNQTTPQAPVQPGVNPHMDNMVKALKGGI